MTTPAAVTPPMTRALVAAHVDGRLAAADLARVDAWLAACGACAGLHRDLEDLVVATRALPTPVRPRDFSLTPRMPVELAPARRHRAGRPPSGRRGTVHAAAGCRAHDPRHRRSRWSRPPHRCCHVRQSAGGAPRRQRSRRTSRLARQARRRGRAHAPAAPVPARPRAPAARRRAGPRPPPRSAAGHGRRPDRSDPDRNAAATATPSRARGARASSDASRRHVETLTQRVGGARSLVLVRPARVLLVGTGLAILRLGGRAASATADRGRRVGGYTRSHPGLRPRTRGLPMERLMLLDGNGLIYRGYFALPPLTTSKGELVNAVFGFCSIVLRGIAGHQAGLRRGRLRSPGPHVPPRAVRRVQGDPPAHAGRPARPVPEGPRGRQGAPDPGLRAGRLRGRRRDRDDHGRCRAARPRYDDRHRRPRHAPARHGPHAPDDDALRRREHDPLRPRADRRAVRAGRRAR